MSNSYSSNKFRERVINHLEKIKNSEDLESKIVCRIFESNTNVGELLRALSDAGVEVLRKIVT